MTNLIGTGKIVGLIELSSDYLYDFDSFSNKMADFYITVEKPSFVLVPHGGWSGAERSLVQKILPKPLAKTVKAARIFNKPIEAAKKLGQGYCLDASLMLVEVGSVFNEIKNRSVFQKLINQKLKENDLLMVIKIYRCSRNTLEFLKLQDILVKKNITFNILLKIYHCNN